MPHSSDDFGSPREALGYLLVLPVVFYRVGPGRVEIESAFAEHLRLLRQMLEPRFGRFVFAGVAMGEAQRRRWGGSLAEIDEERDGIRFEALHPSGRGNLAFCLLDYPRLVVRIARLARDAALVHSGISHNLFRPIEFTAILIATLLRRRTLFFVDIDHRGDAWRHWRTGAWSRKSYLLCRYVYDPLRALQMHLAVRICSLLCLKGETLCRDYGRGRPNVRNLLDAAHSASYLVSPAALDAKLVALRDPHAELEVVYFGRLVHYKGVDLALRAVAQARGAGLRIGFRVIGGGPERERLEGLARELGIADRVSFVDPVPYGEPLFRALAGSHLLLAAPRAEDTPRNALDAMCNGIPILAFDTSYYRSLARSGACEVVPWLSIEGLVERLVALDARREELARRSRAAVEFARDNTQEIWLRRRVEWIDALFEPEQGEPAGIEPGRGARPRAAPRLR